jgi:SAM-dependent methyltransferase
MKDNFSRQAGLYAQFRPVYPPQLYQFILSLVPGRSAAWDCGTGNGQVAVVLADHFVRVEATDISARQLEQAPVRPNLTYTLTPAEQTPFADATFDLITVAQAVHWFDFDRFYAEVRRVLRPGGILALWGYGLMRTGDPAVDHWIDDFYHHRVGPYWDAERSLVDAAYQTIPFPFPEIPAPAFAMEYRWTRDHLLGYLSTWSAVQHYRRANEEDPLEAPAKILREIWPDGTEKSVRFPLFLRIGGY